MRCSGVGENVPDLIFYSEYNEWGYAVCHLYTCTCTHTCTHRVTWLLKEQRGPADSKCFIYVMADPLCIIKALKDTQSIQRETDEER